MTRLISAIALSALVVACGDGAGNSSVGPDAGMVDPDGGTQMDRSRAVRTREDAVLYWAIRPDLETGTVPDLSPTGTENFQLGDSLFWFDDQDNGVYLAPGAELQADLDADRFAEETFSIDFWWKAEPDRASVQVLRIGEPEATTISVRLEEMRRWVVEVNYGVDEPLVASWEVDRDAFTDPMHVTLTFDRWRTLRIYSFGMLERGLVMPPEFTFPSDMTVRFGDGTDGAADGVLHTAAVYNRTLSDAEIWDHGRVGPFPREADEVATSPRRWVSFASRWLQTDKGESFDVALLNSTEPDRHFEDFDTVRLDNEDTVLARWWFDRLQTAGPIERIDARGWASSFAVDSPRNIELSPTTREWIPSVVTWNSTGLVDWTEPGALARPDDRSNERFLATVKRPGPIWLTVPDEIWDGWLEDPATNNGFVLRSDTGNAIEICSRGCGRAQTFLGALVGTLTVPDGPAVRAPEVIFGALGDGGLEIVVETDFCGDPSDELPPCVTEVYARGELLGTSSSSSVIDRNWRPDQGMTYRVYVYDENLQPSEPFDGAP